MHHPKRGMSGYPGDEEAHSCGTRWMEIENAESISRSFNKDFTSFDIWIEMKRHFGRWKLHSKHLGKGLNIENVFHEDAIYVLSLAANLERVVPNVCFVCYACNPVFATTTEQDVKSVIVCVEQFAADFRLRLMAKM